MSVNAASQSVFDAGLPTIDYDVTATPGQVYPQLRAAQRLSPIALGPFGPEVLSYELVRTVLRDSRFQVPPGYILAVQGITSGPRPPSTRPCATPPSQTPCCVPSLRMSNWQE